MEISDIITELKKQVRWDMDWSDMKEQCPDNDNITNKPDVEVIFEQEVALAILLLSGTVFVNSHWWKNQEGWPTEACESISLNVNQNDILAWGVADAEELKYADIQEVYEYWEKDPLWGTAIWFCKKMKMMPQKPVADKIRSAGIWDIDSMGLRKNYCD